MTTKIHPAALRAVTIIVSGKVPIVHREGGRNMGKLADLAEVIERETHLSELVEALEIFHTHTRYGHNDYPYPGQCVACAVLAKLNGDEE